MSNAEIILKQMLVDVKNHKRDPKTLLKFYVEQRLDASLKVYYDQLTKSVQQLNNYNEKSVLNKLVKNTDKNIEKKDM